MEAMKVYEGTDGRVWISDGADLHTDPEGAQEIIAELTDCLERLKTGELDYYDKEAAQWLRRIVEAVPQSATQPPTYEAHRAFVQAVIRESDRGVCPVCSYLWSECECEVDAAAVYEESLKHPGGVGVSEKEQQQ